jgi:hypothetical protein
MAIFIIDASETVYYSAEVEANSEQEARNMAELGIVTWGEPYDGQFFEIVSIIEEESAE